MRWLIKHEFYTFAYNSTDQSNDTRWDQLHGSIALEAQHGWEPWGIEVKHTFNRDYTVLTSTASVWFKRSDE